MGVKRVHGFESHRENNGSSRTPSQCGKYCGFFRNEVDVRAMNSKNIPTLENLPEKLGFRALLQIHPGILRGFNPRRATIPLARHKPKKCRAKTEAFVSRWYTVGDGGGLFSDSQPQKKILAD